MTTNRKKMLESKIGTFQKRYSRKAQKGVEPNDRKYDKKFEKIIKRLDPEELSELLHGKQNEDEKD